MNNKPTAVLIVCVSCMLVGLAPWPATPAVAAAPAAAAETEDIISLDDGRTLHGKIVSETDDEIVFELIDRDKTGKIRSRAKITLDKSKVVGIELGVALKTAAPAAPASAPSQPATSTKPATTDADDEAAADEPKPDEGPKTTGESTDVSLPLIYEVPLGLPKGRQMGTDVSPDIYREVVKDIKAQKPALIVFEMDCRDVEDKMMANENKAEFGMLLFDEFRELANLLKDELREYPQVMWVRDAQGVAAMFALAWSDLYMTSTARLGGLDSIVERYGASKWSDADVRAKMESVMYGYINGFLEYGKYPVELGYSMIVPKYELSASFVGRGVKWTNDDSGHYILDDNDEMVVHFNSRAAENFAIADGTVDNLDDLLFLLGYREYRTDQGRCRKMVEEYIKSWRRAFDDCKTAFQDYRQFRAWATGEDTIAYLGKAKKCLQQIVAAMRRYKAVELRVQAGGYNITSLEVEIEQIEEQIRALNRTGGSGGGRRSGGGSGTGTSGR